MIFKDIKLPTSISSTSLDPCDWNELRAQAHRMLDDMLDYTEGIRMRPVWQVIPDEIRARFCDQLPVAPTKLEQVHKEFMQSVLPFAACNTHPGFMGWAQGGGTPVGMLAEMLAAGLNANVGGRDQIPLEVEHQVVEWMRTLFSFPKGASGLFVTGTSMAHFISVIVARYHRLGGTVRCHGMMQCAQKLTAYASLAVHGSVGRAMDFAGLGSESLRLVAMDSRQRMNLGALSEAIAADKAAGFTPFLVVGTAGTVDTGAIDDLSGIAELCVQQNLWFHVDGAYGALAMLAPDLASRLKGIERADSLAFDFHKWAQVPYDAGFILVRDGVSHQQAFASSSSYLHRENRGMAGGSPWPCDFGPDLSRGFRALKVWATFKVYGTDAIGATISRTCELARYLESKITAAPELELMASVELNIVCFRYRFSASSGTAPDMCCNQLNSSIVVALHESGQVAPSTTLIRGHVVIRAAIVNHRTTHTEIDMLLEAVLREGSALLRSSVPAKRAKNRSQPRHMWEARILQLDVKLGHARALPKKTETDLRFERAILLTKMDRNLEARKDHLRVLELDPTHRSNLINLGRHLVSTCRLKAAQMVYSEAVKTYPKDIICRVNLGSVLLERDDHAGAREQYEAALQIDPEFPQAHGGMYYALTRLGETETAKQHQRKAFNQINVIPNPYRGASEPVSVLLLVSSTGGNAPIERLLDDRIFQTYVIVADFYDKKRALPVHQLVINGIGDADVAEEALAASESILSLTSAPILNLPSAIRATNRCENARRLSPLPGVLAPTTSVFSRTVLAGSGGPAALSRQGFKFPLLLRTPGFHMGQHFLRVEAATGLAAAVAELPGDELIAIEYLDARGTDGNWRKFRVMIVAGRLYPLHLAISENWKIHYFSADMASRPDHRAEDARFLADMPGVLGTKAMAALERVQQELNLDYWGIDFGLSPEGELLLFEANATMIVQQPDEGELWDYRRPAVERIHAAVHQMLLTSAGTVCA